MPNERNYYVFRDDNCRFEGMTKEQIIEAIAEATGNVPSGIDEAFITKLQEQNEERSIKLWVGTEAQYNALETKATDTLYAVFDSGSVLRLASHADIPTKTSDLVNDSGFISQATIPSKTSELENDSGFVDDEYVDAKTGIHIETLTGTSVTAELESGKEYRCTNAVTGLTLTFAGGEEGLSECWAIQFEAGSGLSPTLPNTVSWAAGAPTYTAGHRYYLSFIRLGSNYLGAWAVI